MAKEKRWLEDETVGVMPISAIAKEDKGNVYPGAIAKLKWKKLYDAENIWYVAKYLTYTQRAST